MEDSQETSIFFILPIEIRNVIYDLCVPIYQKEYVFSDFKDLNQGISGGDDIPSFLRTCKRVYKEAKSIICAFATLTLNGRLLSDPSDLYYRPSTIRGAFPCKLSSVRNLQIQLGPYYEHSASFVDFLKECGKNLKQLRTIHFHYSKQQPTYLGWENISQILGLTHRSVVLSLVPYLMVHGNLRVIKMSGDWRYESERVNRLIKRFTERYKMKVLILSDLEAAQELCMRIGPSEKDIVKVDG